MSNPTTPGHEHARDSYLHEANELDRVLRDGLATLHEQADRGEIGAVEHALLRVAAVEQHLAESKALRIKYFGDNS